MKVARDLAGAVASRDLQQRGARGTAILGAAMGRHLDERLWVRAPGMYRRLSKLVGKLRPGSAVRGRFLKRATERGWAELSRGDDEVCLLFFDPDFEFNIIGWAPIAGLAERFHGHEGWLGFIALSRAEWVDSQITTSTESSTTSARALR